MVLLVFRDCVLDAALPLRSPPPVRMTNRNATASLALRRRGWAPAQCNRFFMLHVFIMKGSHQVRESDVLDPQHVWEPAASYGKTALHADCMFTLACAQLMLQGRPGASFH